MNLRSSLIPLAIATAFAGLSSVTLAQTQPAAPAAPDAKGRQALEAAFAKADVNGDGKLSRDEAAKLPAIAAKFDTLDKDKDGSLSLAEFAVGYMAAG